MYIYNRPLVTLPPIRQEEPSPLQRCQRHYWHNHVEGLEQPTPDPLAGFQESPRMQKRLKEALEQMRQSSDPNEQVAATEILNGSYVVTFPPLLLDKSQKDESVSLDTAITRLRNSEMPGQPKASIYIFPHFQLNAYGKPLPGQVGTQFPGLNANAVTFATDGDRHIYLLRSDPGFNTKKLKMTLLHEAFHLRYPLPRGYSSRDKFIVELRAYYYAEYRDVKDLTRRFELAARSAAKDSKDVSIDGPDFAARVANRSYWFQQIAL
jgi:hypothetical protein